MALLTLAGAGEAASLDDYGLLRVSARTAQWFTYALGRLERYSGCATVDQLTPRVVASWVQYERQQGASPGRRVS